MANGEVEFSLHGERVILKPTLGATRTINRTYGSFGEAFRRVSLLDFETIANVIAVGSGMKPKTAEEEVYAHGLADLVKPVSEYLSVLSNGGRSPDDDEQKDDDTPGEG